MSAAADLVWILPTRRNLVAGAAAFLMALCIGGFGAALAFDPKLGGDTRVTAAVLCALVAVAFVNTGVQLMEYRGGLVLDRTAARLGFRLTSPADTWWVPLDRVRGVTLSTTAIRRGGSTTRAWACQLVLEDAPPVLIAESEDEPSVLEVHEMILAASGLTEVAFADLPAPPVATEGMVQVGVRIGAALQMTLFLLGASLLVMGIAMMSRMRVEPGVGLFVAPVMALIGACFAGVALAKRLATEELRHAQGSWHHVYRWGRLRWGARSVTGRAPTWRLHMQALRGANLELVGEDGILLIGGGATTRSRAGIRELAQLPAHFAPRAH